MTGTIHNQIVTTIAVIAAGSAKVVQHGLVIGGQALVKNRTAAKLTATARKRVEGDLGCIRVLLYTWSWRQADVRGNC